MPRFGEAPGFTAADRANLEAILADTGTTLDAALAAVDANVDAILVDTGTTLDALIQDIFALSDTPRSYTYPAAAALVTFSSTTTPWSFGTWAEIVPEDTITETFWFFGFTANATSTPQAAIEIATGAAGSEVVIAQMAGAADAGRYGRLWQLPWPRKISANTRLSARVATEGTSVITVYVKAIYATGL